MAMLAGNIQNQNSFHFVGLQLLLTLNPKILLRSKQTTRLDNFNNPEIAE